MEGKGQSLTFHGKNHLTHHTCLVSIILALLWKTVFHQMTKKTEKTELHMRLLTRMYQVMERKN